MGQTRATLWKCPIHQGRAWNGASLDLEELQLQIRPGCFPESKRIGFPAEDPAREYPAAAQGLPYQRGISALEKHLYPPEFQVLGDKVWVRR